MRRLISIILIFLAFEFSASAQSDIQWQKSLGGTAGDWANDIRQTSDGGYIMAGYSGSNDGDVSGHHGNSLSYDYWIVKLQANGSIQWQKSLGGSSDDIARSIIQTNDGGYIIAGSSASNDGDVIGNHGNSDYWIVKLNSAGATTWKKCYGGSRDDEAYSIRQTTDGGYIVAGSTYSNDSDITVNYGNYDYWIVKLSSSGSLQWQKSLGGLGDDEAYAIQQTTDGGYIVTGASNSKNGDITGNKGTYDYWVVKLNSTGTIVWKTTLGGSSEDYSYSVQQTLDGGYIVAGYSSSNDSDVTGNQGIADYWIVKLNNNGAIQWQQSLGGSTDDESYSIQQTTDGGYIVGGYANSSNGNVTGNHGFYDYWIVKLSATGTIQWERSFGGTNNEFARAIQQTTDGGYIVAGWSYSNDGDVSGNHGQEDCWIVKISSSVGVETYSSRLLNVSTFPNPASENLTIDLKDHNGAGLYNMYITDATGKKILSADNILTYHQEITFNIREFSAGVYFVQLTNTLPPAETLIAKFIKQ